tara:strand:- start:921 stop:1343 length:423 start_codon:yes stop_codon:yes gene_type:complete
MKKEERKSNMLRFLSEVNRFKIQTVGKDAIVTEDGRGVIAVWTEKEYKDNCNLVSEEEVKEAIESLEVREGKEKFRRELEFFAGAKVDYKKDGFTIGKCTFVRFEGENFEKSLIEKTETKLGESFKTHFFVWTDQIKVIG